jgi:uncharacterized membrane protein (DUF2068 family)
MATPHDPTLKLIALFKLLKGVLLLALAFGVSRLLHQDLALVLTGWLDELRIDPGNKYAATLLSKVGLLSEKNLQVLGWLTFAYAAIFLTEGVGLFLKKRWAEWFVIITTGSFVPVEVYELCQHRSWLKVVLLLANLAIVAFLIWRLRQTRNHRAPRLSDAL